MNDHIIKNSKPGKWAVNYEQYKDFLKSDEKVIESKKDTEYLEWYEKWKKENFNNDDPIDKDRKRYGG